MSKVKKSHISDNDFRSDYDNDNLLGTVHSPTPYTPNLNTALLRSNFAENPPLSSTTPSMPTEKCVICSGTPAYTDGPNIFPTCGKACSSKLLEACGNGLSNTNESHTSNSPNTSSTPNISDKDREPPRQSSEPTRIHADKQIEMCVICNAAPAHGDGSKIYPTCGRACTSKLLDAYERSNTNEARTNMSSVPNIFDKDWESPKRSSELTQSQPDRSMEMYVDSSDAPAYRDGPEISPTFGMANPSKPPAAYDLPIINEPRTSDPPSMSSAPNTFDKNRESPRRTPELTRTYTSRAMEMDGPKIHPTFGRADPSKLPAAYDLPIINEPRTSDPPSMSSARNIFDKNRESPRRTPELPRTYTDGSMEMHGPKMYPTFGMADPSKLPAYDLPITNKPRISDLPSMFSAPNISDKNLVSPRRSSELARTYTSRAMEINGPKMYPTFGMANPSKLPLAAAYDLPITNEPRTSDPPSMSSVPNKFDKNRESPRRSSELARTYTSRAMEINGPKMYPTFGMANPSKLPAAYDLPITNEPRTSDPPSMSSVPNIFDKNRESPRRSSELTQTYTNRAMEMHGPKIHPTFGMAYTSKLPAGYDLPNTNEPRTSNPPSMSSTTNIFDKNRESPRRTSELTRTYADRSIDMCVICHDAPVYRDGPKIYPTCGMACASRLQAASGLPNPNKTRTSDLLNGAFMSSVSPRNNADITHSHSRPNQTQIGMCDVCHVRPRCQREGKIYPTCGLSCAAKLELKNSSSVEMCDYCEKRPKVIIEGKTYPQCGKTCRDKAKFAKTLCILCQKSTKAGESDFCSKCQSLADNRAPFLIEIPRGHVAFEKVAEVYASEWQTSETHCPTIKKVYMVVMKKTFKKTFEKYSTKIGPRNILFKRKKCTSSLRWLVFLRECGFGDPGNLEPCTSNKCLMCSIVRSTFNHSDFPGGITTSGLNRTVELSRSGNESSSKIVAMTRVVVGREAEMSPHDAEVVRPLPPPNTDSVHVIGERNDGSRLDLGEIIVYDGDAVWPLYLISYDSE